MRSAPSGQRICQYPGPGVALKVKNLDKSLAFYTEKMGFSEMLRRNHDDGRVWLVYLRITDDQYLEIFPGAVQDSAPGPETNGINHFCLVVEDIEKFIRQLSRRTSPFTTRSKPVLTIIGRPGFGIPMATGSSSWKWDPTLCN
jgi:catechol 2,3-dioxygenase-like lactoylglutathione lyase family enzyme